MVSYQGRLRKGSNRHEPYRGVAAYYTEGVFGIYYS